MIVNQIIPQKIYIEDENDLQTAQELLKEQNLTTNKKLEINSWSTILKEKNYYIVKPADTISSVAKTLNITEQELLNKISTKNIFIGQKINI